jgi:DNA-binding CsgD family transcriptional regulator
MARPRAELRESLEKIDDLLHMYSGAPQEPRVRMLRLLGEDPGRTLADVSRVLATSERTVERWWQTYASDGLASLLSVGRRGGRRRRISDEALQDFRANLESDGFRTISDAQEWLRERYGIEYGRTAIWNLLRAGTRASRGLWTVHQARGSAHIAGRSDPSHAFQSDFVAFLNALPSTTDPVEWITTFREALLGLFEEVDRISIVVNTLCDLVDPEEYVPTFSIRMHTKGGTIPSGSISIGHVGERRGRFEEICEDFRQKGFPIHEYHAPHGFDYHYKGHAYLGTIILWREVTAPPISDHTIDAIQSLEPFLTFMLTDLVTRHEYMKPVDRVFHDAFDRLVEEAALSPQERRIIVLQLRGYSYKEMADLLSVSVDTVKKHFKQIHRKTGTRGQAELFAKYFTANLSSREALED